MGASSEKNKKIVSEFYDMALNQKKPEEAVSKYMGEIYRQHNPTAGDGAEAFINFVKGFVKQYPALHLDFKRFIAEGDLVVVHSHLKLNPADRGTAVIDIFRLNKGKVVKHWDVQQQVPEKSANKNMR